MSEITKEDVVKFIENMTVLELSELVKELEDRFGVSAAAPVAVAAMPGAGAAAEAAPEEEKTEFDVVITSVGDKKIQVIKEVRAVTSLGLKEAKDLVENLPGVVKEGIPKAEAEEIAKKLTEAGATVEVK
ncbi:50S ribosomal protein L7/L12 [Desulfoglaeba alkanexedens]|jgi:large subunit ribosomal protein L7/L12|uniref:Large ribosomal subunit protein bL12 n=1 Tax=Desulfoglaeba alkanexedens ALDC TaxID=980445 RepID=A0A4P8L0C6_9BACT|nr:50S ribosomal protein L7/L12 [Desulfoglaeba alkanexedens]QCQ21064.1 50S ribosomal protein L7/L12 [Desulfoglaeba alkanexedens ALDC]